ncbi:K(+)-transporting ATPase subunit F, partial [Pseudomonas juntendi]
PSLPLHLVPLHPFLGQFPKAAQAASRGEPHMNMLDGLSLLLAVALAFYLLVALLRADRG